MRKSRAVSIIAIMAATIPSALLAEITAEGFWAHWEQRLAAEDSGVTVGAVERKGETVILRDVALYDDDPQAPVLGPIPEIRLSDKDGGIEVSISEEMPFHIFSAQQVVRDGIMVEELRDMTGRVLAPGASARLEGNAPDFLTMIAVDAPDVQAIVDAETRAGNLIDSDILARLTGGKARYAYGPKGGDHSLDLAASATSLALNGRKADPAMFVGEFRFDGAMDAPALNFSMAAPRDFLFDETFWDSETLPADSKVTGSLVVGAATLNLNIPGKIAIDQNTVGAGEMVLSMAAQSTNLSGELAQSEVAMLANMQSAGMALSGAGAPIPLEGQFAEFLADIRLPTAKSDTSTDFHWINRLTDLRLPDEAWDRIDSAKRLPRDPVNLELDISGKGRSTYDWITFAGNQPPDPPMIVDWLKLGALRLSGAGAELTGSGEATFPTDTVHRIGDVPLPLGKLNLKLVGGNTLLENLTAMGLFSEDELMGIRLGSGMIFKAGEGEDVMVSEMEATEQGTITVNGMRMR